MHVGSILASAALAAAVVAAACAAGPALFGSRQTMAIAESQAPAAVPVPADRFESADPDGVELVRLSVATTPAEVRNLLRFCREAGVAEAATLRSAAFDSPDPLVAGSAARALGRIGALAADADASRLLRDSRARVRQEAAIGLGLSGDPAALDDLEPLLECGDPAVGPLVIQAIGRIGGARAEEMLRRRMADECTSEVERVFLAEALRGLDPAPAQAR